MDPIIRRAKRADIPRLIDLGEKFAYLSQPIHGFNVDRTSIIEFTNEAVDSDEALVLVLECDGVVQGFIAGTIHKIYFSKDVALQELAWYAEKGFKGILLFEAFEVMANAIGVDHLIVGNKPQFCDLTNLYKRRGFSLLENHFTKDLKCRSSHSQQPLEQPLEPPPR